MKKLFVFLSVFSIIFLSHGKKTTEKEALEIAKKFLISKNLDSRAQVGNLYISFVSRDSLDNSKVNFFVCHSDNHDYVIVSADDFMPEVLGYSSNSNSNNHLTNPAFHYWLSEYDRTIEYVRSQKANGNTSIKVSTYSGKRYDVPPLVQTTWGQGQPFNNYCPQVGNTKAPSGCVATAMAQIMNYHKWPQRGKGEHNSINFEKSTYRWNEMLDNYTQSYSQSSGEAVAVLLRDCGAAVDMDYGEYESGASSSCIPFALYTHFDYDGGLIKTIQRDCVKYEDFIEAIYEDLNKRLPIFYSGKHRNGGGHQFILDGCDDEGYFHFNWGWDGIQDGNFLILNVEDPNYLSNTNTNGYINNVSIITGVQPNKNSGKDPEYPVLYCLGNISLTIGNNNSVTIRNSGFYCNYGGEYLTFTLGAKLIGKKTGETYFCTDSPTKFENTRPGWSINQNNYTVTIPTVPDDEYTVIPVQKVKDKDDWHEFLYPLGYKTSGTIIVKDGKATYLPAKLEVTDPYFVPEFEAGKYTNYHVTVKNVGNYEYSGPIKLVISNGFDKSTTYSKDIYLEVGEKMNLEFSIFINLPIDEYVAGLVDYASNRYQLISVSVKTDPSVTIDEEHFPDPIFRKSVSDKWDSDKDGIITLADLGRMRGLSLYQTGYTGVKDISGIKYLTGLTYFGCESQEIKEINISSISNLMNFRCHESSVEKLDASNCINLLQIVAYYNFLKEVNVRESNNLEFLCFNFNDIEEIDLADKPKLWGLEIHTNKLRRIDLQGCPNLTTLLLSKNQLVALDLSDCDKLETFSANNNERTVNVNENNDFDLDALIPDGFDLNRCSNWSGGVVTGHTLKFQRSRVNYSYDTRKGHITFTLVRGEVTGINNVSEDEVQFSIDNKLLTVYNLRTTVSIYDSTGRQIYQGSQSQIELPHSGLYIIKFNNTSKKVIVR